MKLGEPKFSRDFELGELRLLRILVCLLFLGRAWQGIFWDLPLRTFFWDQSLLEGVVTTLTGDTWQHYVTNESINIDKIINVLGCSLGFFWAFCAIFVLLVKKEWKFGKWLMYAGSLSFFLLALLYFKDKFWQVGQFFEYATQVTAPLIFVHVLYGGKNTFYFRRGVKLIIAITFFCHGLYACAYYPQPGIWIQWCMDVFGFRDDLTARQFLIWIGWIDFAVAILLFVPIKTFSWVAIWYCIIWGTMTSFARIVGNFYVTMIFESLHQHVYETLYRLVHGGIPLFLWYCYRRKGANTDPSLKNEV
ncbi:hypothetical protein [Aureispira anguillae]|uniref:Uncharacterized protein n=1 Tax=Aureispira anguillae TaxID=2864201 RepID=A0A915YEM9_9BACT|nr:hypothetical protein [Aureispira anguillae]BDS11644.1 hypothetical protein AsAng_0023580 [Aureispira anguillae]